MKRSSRRVSTPRGHGPRLDRLIVIVDGPDESSSGIVESVRRLRDEEATVDAREVRLSCRDACLGAEGRVSLPLTPSRVQEALVRDEVGLSLDVPGEPAPHLEDDRAEEGPADTEPGSCGRRR